MERQRSQEPGQQHANHDPSLLSFPKVPQTEPTKVNVHAADITLPGISTVLSPEFTRDGSMPPSASEAAAMSHASPGSVRSLPPIDLGLAAGRRNDSQDAAMKSPSDAESVRSDERGRRTTSVVSMDDEKVRIAAEALSGLGNAEYVRSPTSATHQHLPPMHSNRSSQQMPNDSEPLLQLFASKYPIIGGTINGSINGSMYVYNTTKYYSPRFVQSGANLIERNIAAPMVNTVGSVGRMTGVEGGLRRHLDHERPDDLEQGGRSSDKRIRLDADAMDIDAPEHLPAYRASKPPSYREEYSPAATERSQQRPTSNRSWSSQVAGQMFVTTSGLGVALSVTSRRSLRYCLGALGAASTRITTISDALKIVLQQYDQARDSWHQQNDSSIEKGERPRTPDHDDAARRLAEVIKHHCDEIWRTLQSTVNYVSNSAGGALPENARQFVTTQLMSLPQRWRLVSSRQTGESETSRGAHRMIEFATEGLDMMSQVSQVMTATLESAERWLARVGRREGEYQQRGYYNAEKPHGGRDDPRGYSDHPT